MAEKKETAMGEVQGGQPSQEDEVAKLEALLKTPLSKEEAEKIFSDIEIRRAQLAIIRQKWSAQLTQMQLQIADLDQELLALELDRAVAFRRTLVAPAGGTEAK